MTQVNTGLNDPFGHGKGHSQNFILTYDSTLASADGQDRTNALLATIDNDFNKIASWFPGTTFPWTFPVTIQVAAGATSGAAWGPPLPPSTIVLTPGNGEPVNFLRYLLASELPELFMAAKKNGWGYSYGDSGDEGSKGEALSRFLAYKFLSDQSPDTSFVNSLSFTVSNNWLATTARTDFVNINPDDNKPDATTGCTTLFLYYLFSQLAFTDVVTIINDGGRTLADVYRTLTGDVGDPFPLFSRVIGASFPTSPFPQQITSGPNFDNPFPLGILSFWVENSTFSRDQVQDIMFTQGGFVHNAFWLVLEGFSINSFNSYNVTISQPTGSLTSLGGIEVSSDNTIVFEDPSNLKIPQRIRFSYAIRFLDVTAFPATNGTPVFGDLTGTAQINGEPVHGATASTIFELFGGENPYFTNIDKSNAAQEPYLSQDLRVFAAPAGTSILGSPALTNDPYASIQNILGHLNSTVSFTSPNTVDPLGALPGQSGYETGDTSVFRFDTAGRPQYNFALARVRLKALSQPTATNVRVFFRLWVATSTDTDFHPNTTYTSNKGTSGADSGLPIAPTASNTGLVDPSGNSLQTIPFFATDASGTSDYDESVTTNNRNIHTIQIPVGNDEIWTYFGCFLDVYDASNNARFPGTHHCIVAEIAYDDTPIPTTTPSGYVPSPFNWDKLAQRNLQITRSENPQSPFTHVVPQPFDLRPSTVFADVPQSMLGLPDELMIDWGQTPSGSRATIFWPQVLAQDVLDLADQIYGTHLISVVDLNTIQVTTTNGATYIPIPQAGSKRLVNFAGLFTVTLPTTICNGQEFHILVRRISSVNLVYNNNPRIDRPPALLAVQPGGRESIQKGKRATPFINPNASGSFLSSNVEIPQRKTNALPESFMRVRQAVSSFIVHVPVTTKEVMLPAENSTLAALKWRLQEMDTVNRWYPVLQRYVDIVSKRVDGLGGSARKVPPSLGGLPLKPGKGGYGDGDRDGEKGGCGCECCAGEKEKARRGGKCDVCGH
jgi:hypothetical protein